VKSRLRTVLCCLALQVGALVGVPMRPEEIQELMQTLAQPTLARTNPDRPDDGDLPPAVEGEDVRIRRGWRLLGASPGRAAASARSTPRWWRRWRVF
jgi:hypothetical protein